MKYRKYQILLAAFITQNSRFIYNKMLFKVFKTTYSRVAFLFMRIFSLALLPSVCFFSRPHVKPSAFVLPVSLEGSGCKRQLYIALNVFLSCTPYFRLHVFSILSVNERWHDFFGHGDFVLYRNKERTFEVRNVVDTAI